MGILEGKKIAFIFPGQGSQAIGMGKGFYDCCDECKELFHRADDILGFSLSELCFNGPEDDLKRTINTQPALYTVSCVAFNAAKAKGIKYAITAGHSVGEYAALYASGAFSFEEGLKLVRKRAVFMEEAAKDNKGTMAAILGLSPLAIIDIVNSASEAGVVVAANFNSPIQTVISGDEAGVARASELAKEAGAKRIVPLNVSGGFHSPLMQKAADNLKSALDSAEIFDPAVPVVANITADFQKTADEIKENLAKQITGSVRWVESVEKMLEEGVEVFIELGAGNVLAGLIKRIAPDAAIYSIENCNSFDTID
ncbi:MAG: ACP S-malonyltransferase [Armatimonadota bacterium]